MQPADPDLASTAQLREAFRQVEELREVRLEVRGGVAVLRGEVSSLQQSQQAAELAQKVDGVIAVDNGITVRTRVTERLSPALEKLSEKAATVASYLPLAGVALLIVMTAAAAGKVFNRWSWFYSRLSPNVFIQDLLKYATSVFFLLIGCLVALELLEATALVGAVLGTAGVLGVAIGFAFRDLAENSLASILLSLKQPFSPNDLVEIDGRKGIVVRLTSRATILLTLDGNHLRIPNATVFKATILNYTRNPRRRFDFVVGIDTEQSITKAQSLAVATLAASPGVLENPPPLCVVEVLGESSINLSVLGWVDQTNYDFVKVRSEAIRLVKEAFDSAGIVMPEPIYRVRIDRGSPLVEGKVSPPEVEPAHPADVSAEQHLTETVRQERREGLQDDLLSAQGRPE